MKTSGWVLSGSLATCAFNGVAVYCDGPSEDCDGPSEDEESAAPDAVLSVAPSCTPFVRLRARPFSAERTFPRTCRTELGPPDEELFPVLAPGDTLFPPVMSMVLVDGVVGSGSDGSDESGASFAPALRALVKTGEAEAVEAFGDVSCGEGDGAG